MGKKNNRYGCRPGPGRAGVRSIPCLDEWEEPETRRFAGQDPEGRRFAPSPFPGDGRVRVPPPEFPHPRPRTVFDFSRPIGCPMDYSRFLEAAPVDGMRMARAIRSE